MITKILCILNANVSNKGKLPSLIFFYKHDKPTLFIRQ